MNKRQALADSICRCGDNLQTSVNEEYFFDKHLENIEKFIAQYRESLIPATPEEKRMLADSCERLTDGKHL